MSAKEYFDNGSSPYITFSFPLLSLCAICSRRFVLWKPMSAEFLPWNRCCHPISVCDRRTFLKDSGYSCIHTSPVSSHHSVTADASVLVTAYPVCLFLSVRRKSLTTFLLHSTLLAWLHRSKCLLVSSCVQIGHVFVDSCDRCVEQKGLRGQQIITNLSRENWAIDSFQCY